MVKKRKLPRKNLKGGQSKIFNVVMDTNELPVIETD